VSEARSLAELEGAVHALVAWSKASGVPMLVIGGVAVSILSKPRTTKDVDVVAWLPDQDAWRAFLTDGERHGIVPRIPDALGFALRSRVLLLRHEPSGVPIDVSMGALPFEENAVRRAVLTEIGGIRIPLPIPEDLLVMKAVAHRSRDWVQMVTSSSPGRRRPTATSPSTITYSPSAEEPWRKMTWPSMNVARRKTPWTMARSSSSRSENRGTRRRKSASSSGESRKGIRCLQAQRSRRAWRLLRVL